MHWALAFGGLAGLLALVVLIWNQRLRRQLRSRSEDRLRLALEGTNTGLYEWFPETGEVYLSPTWLSMPGYAPDAFSHAYESWAELLYPEDRSQAERTLGALHAQLDELSTLLKQSLQQVIRA